MYQSMQSLNFIKRKELNLMAMTKKRKWMMNEMNDTVYIINEIKNTLNIIKNLERCDKDVLFSHSS